MHTLYILNNTSAHRYIMLRTSTLARHDPIIHYLHSVTNEMRMEKNV